MIDQSSRESEVEENKMIFEGSQGRVNRSQELYHQRSASFQHRPHQQHDQNVITTKYKWLLLIFLVCICFCIFYKVSGEPEKSTSRLPKIVWIYTYTEWQGENAIKTVHFHYLNHTAISKGYEVRIVNSWTAYDWLSPEVISNITKSIQKNQVDETVCSLLKLALLIEHGGIMVARNNFLLPTNDFKWIEDIFSHAQEKSQDKDQQSKVEVYVPLAQARAHFNYYFHEDIIAAVPESQFIRLTFQRLRFQVIEQGRLSGSQSFFFFKKNLWENTDYIPNSIASVMTSIIYQFIQKNNNQLDAYKNYKIYKQMKGKLVDMLDNDHIVSLQLIQEAKRHTDHVIYVNTFEIMEEILSSSLMYGSVKPINQNSLLMDVLSVPHNRHVFIDLPPPRKIDFCIIYIDKLTTIEILNATTQLQKQTYKRWELVIFPKETTSRPKLPSNSMYLDSSGNQIRDIEVAMTQHCNPRAYAVLMKAGDKFNKVTALETIAKNVQPRDIIGACINLKTNQTLREAQTDYLNFSRSAQGQLNPNITKMNAILNHFRVISVESFRILPQMEYRTLEGVYFQDRMIFLSGLLEMLLPHIAIGVPPVPKYKYEYIKRKYEPVYNVPTRAVLIDPEVHIETCYYDPVNESQIVQTRARYNVETMQTAMAQTQEFKIPFSKVLVFNNGDEYIPPSKKQGPFVIPKIIHRLYIGKNVPVSHQYFYEKSKRLHPNYEVKLWRQQNITRENFPITYNLAQHIIAFQKSGKSPLNKFATVADLLRRQMLLIHGGIWQDGNSNPFRPFPDTLRKYQLVITAELSIRNRWNAGMCWYGSSPNSTYIQRLANYRHMNRMRIYERIAIFIAGPFDFGRIIYGNEEFAPEVLVIHMEYFSPGQENQPPYGDMCVKRESQWNNINRSPIELASQGCILLSDCYKEYPYAFAQDHNCFGVSWLKS